ncbi:MAG: cobalamin-independent methionine synthase II family protein [Gammaproteobacteria bacterium]
MKNSKHRILTTHVGSLVRTPELVELLIRDRLGEPPDSETYEKTLREGERDVVRRQAEIGIDVVDDGEYGKANWITYLNERISGMEPEPAIRDLEAKAHRFWPEQERFGDFYKRYEEFESIQWLPETPSRDRYRGSQVAEYRSSVCTSRLEYKPQALQRDIANLKAGLEGVEVEEAFMPVVAPCSFELVPNHYYNSQEDYLFALAEVLSVEYKMIVDAGFLLQVDDAFLPMQRVLLFRGKPFAEYRRWAEVRMEALNRALKGIPEDRVRYHICFGSQNMPHTTDPALKDIIDLVLSANAQAYAFEASNPRHEHEWQLWRDVKLPEGKLLIPGVVGHATNIVEHPELVALRLKNFAGLVGRENILAGTDCGFSQSWNSPRVHVQVQWAKLQALVEGARLASAELRKA